MITPCSSCPFRHDVSAYIRPERGEEIWKSLEAGAMFPCHKTVEYGDDDDDDEDGSGRVTGKSEFCAGALILMEREWTDDGGAMQNQMVRIHTRTGSPRLLEDLDKDAPVFNDLESWIDHLAEGS